MRCQRQGGDHRPRPTFSGEPGAGRIAALQTAAHHRRASPVRPIGMARSYATVCACDAPIARPRYVLPANAERVVLPQRLCCASKMCTARHPTPMIRPCCRHALRSSGTVLSARPPGLAHPLGGCGFGVLARIQVQQHQGDAVGPAEAVLQRVLATAAAGRIGFQAVLFDQLVLACEQRLHLSQKTFANGACQRVRRSAAGHPQPPIAAAPSRWAHPTADRSSLRWWPVRPDAVAFTHGAGGALGVIVRGQAGKQRV